MRSSFVRSENAANDATNLSNNVNTNRLDEILMGSRRMSPGDVPHHAIHFLPLMRAERTVSSARREVHAPRPSPSPAQNPALPAYARQCASQRHPSSQCPPRTRRCVGAYRAAPQSARRRMRPIGYRHVALCACVLGGLMDRLVGRRARGVQRVREAFACASLQLHHSPLPPPPEAVWLWFFRSFIGRRCFTFAAALLVLVL